MRFRPLLRMHLAYLRLRINQARLDVVITREEITTGPARLAHYQRNVQQLRIRAAALEQLLK